MREQIRYRCDYCGTEFEDREMCLKCENTHIKPKSVDSYYFKYRDSDGYPYKIKVKMDDGSIVTYKFGV